MENVVLNIYGMTCTLCSISIESRLRSLKGIKSAEVSYATEKAVFSYDETEIDLEAIKKAVRQLGFSLSEKSAADTEDQSNGELKKLKKLLIVSMLLTFPMLLAMILGGIGFCHDYFFPGSERSTAAYVIDLLRFKAKTLHDWRLQLALATPVQFIIGFKFYKSTFYSLRAGKTTMDSLVVLGSSAAYFYSLYTSICQSNLIASGMKNIYFEASSVIITFVLLGRYLEALSKKRTSSTIKSLLALNPKHATVLRNFSEIEIPADKLVVGDIVLVRPGDKIPADGVVIDGYSTVDESMLTGESIPIDKKPNDPVTGASINNFGSFSFRVTKVGSDTVLSQIIKITTEAQNSKAQIQKTADKVCSLFIPVVLTISAATFLYWFIIVFDRNLFFIDKPIIYAVSVLVVSCPCALGLATPTAIMVGLGRGVKNAVLIKNGEDLEKVYKIDTVVFDKTGTLTEGKLILSDFIVLNKEQHNLTEDSVLFLAAIAEKKSEHPVGQAIYNTARISSAYIDKEPEKFAAVAGNGIQSIVDGRKILIGSRNFLLENLPPDTAAFVDEEVLATFYEAGKIVVFMAIDLVITAVFALEDSLKQSAAKAVQVLIASGIDVIMLTGDHSKTANSLAAKLGIRHVEAEVLPENKASIVAALRKEGRVVAMVGDGINDAPALAASDAGFSIHSGTDVAMETADILLMNDNLLSIPYAIRLSKATLRKIKQNLFWAFIYNAVSIPFAASGHLSPVVASAAMALSSVSVVLNSLLLYKKTL